MQQNIETMQSQEAEEDQFTIRKLLTGWWESFVYSLRYWRIMAVITVVGGLVGLMYAIFKPITYSGRVTFIVEEAKSGSGSLASAVAGQFGLDIGGLTGGNGLLAGDNVQQLVKSQTFIKKTLLTPYNDSASSYSLADRYAEVYGWKEAWQNSSKVGKLVHFPTGQQQFSRTEDSLLQVMIAAISEKEMSISKPDKKLGFFELGVTTRDERFSQLFCERLLKIATDFYVDTKTRRLSNNVARLQKRADSIGGLLDRRTMSSAETERLLLDANPAYSGPVANAEISSRNKMIQSTVYAEIVKNLEISKTALIQETPTVQIVDHPELPLKRNRTSRLLSILAGMLIGGGLTMIGIVIAKPANAR